MLVEVCAHIEGIKEKRSCGQNLWRANGRGSAHRGKGQRAYSASDRGESGIEGKKRKGLLIKNGEQLPIHHVAMDERHCHCSLANR